MDGLGQPQPPGLQRRCARTPYFAPDGRSRPAETPLRTAVGRTLLARRRSHRADLDPRVRDQVYEIGRFSTAVVSTRQQALPASRTHVRNQRRTTGDATGYGTRQRRATRSRLGYRSRKQEAVWVTRPMLDGTSVLVLLIKASELATDTACDGNYTPNVKGIGLHFLGGGRYRPGDPSSRWPPIGLCGMGRSGRPAAPLLPRQRD